MDKKVLAILVGAILIIVGVVFAFQGGGALGYYAG
jgi:hypothetical protein|nr:MAG TPA_asm: hypothetical protein [Caudoviricetes sp.]DAP31238.1 MAG TPA: hypothetical protein [Bacteriophage sp.]